MPSFYASEHKINDISITWGKMCRTQFTANKLMAPDLVTQLCLHKWPVRSAQWQKNRRTTILEQSIARYQSTYHNIPRMVLAKSDKYMQRYRFFSRGGTPRKIGLGCAARLPNPLPYLRPRLRPSTPHPWAVQKFDTLFLKDLTIKSIPCFRPASV